MSEIEDLELQIEDLRGSIRHSRRLMRGGEYGAVVGGLLLALLAFGAIRFSPTLMVIGVALLLGGLVMAGSSKTSTEDLEGALERTEEARVHAISRLPLVDLNGGGRAAP